MYVKNILCWQLNQKVKRKRIATGHVDKLIRVSLGAEFGLKKHGFASPSKAWEGKSKHLFYPLGLLL